MAQVHSTWLYQASFIGNTDEVKELMDGGADVNEPNDVSVSNLILLYNTPSSNSVIYYYPRCECSMRVKYTH